MASDDPAGPGQGSARPVPESCPAGCLAHREHVYILCYGQPVIVKDRDYLLADPATDYPITHYVGYTRQQPPVKRIRSHAARSAHYIAQIRPGTLADEETAKRTEACPRMRRELVVLRREPDLPLLTVPPLGRWPTTGIRPWPLSGREGPADLAARRRTVLGTCPVRADPAGGTAVHGVGTADDRPTAAGAGPGRYAVLQRF